MHTPPLSKTGPIRRPPPKSRPLMFAQVWPEKNSTIFIHHISSVLGHLWLREPHFGQESPRNDLKAHRYCIFPTALKAEGTENF